MDCNVRKSICFFTDPVAGSELLTLIKCLSVRVLFHGAFQVLPRQCPPCGRQCPHEIDGEMAYIGARIGGVVLDAPLTHHGKVL